MKNADWNVNNVHSCYLSRSLHNTCPYSPSYSTLKQTGTHFFFLALHNKQLQFTTLFKTICKKWEALSKPKAIWELLCTSFHWKTSLANWPVPDVILLEGREASIAANITDSKCKEQVKSIMSNNLCLLVFTNKCMEKWKP